MQQIRSELVDLMDGAHRAAHKAHKRTTKIKLKRTIDVLRKPANFMCYGHPHSQEKSINETLPWL